VRRFLPVLIGLLAPAAVALAQAPANPLYDELVQKGVRIPSGPTVKLPPPLFPVAKPIANADALLEKAAGKVPLELFLKSTVTAPFSWKIESVENAKNERCAQLISLRFIAYGKLKSLEETDILKSLLSGKQKGSSESTALRPAELKKRSIKLLEGAGLKDSYGTLSLALLERVQIDGVTHNVRSTLAKSNIHASQLDDRFLKDKEYPNTWRSIIRSAEGESLGPLHPYTGLAGYACVTELTQPKGALLVEMHFVLHEPPAWFGGPNLLRSKLPTVLESNVRSFRRKMPRQ
jgi:hypothetical protein